jgi:hypothetical protein
MRRDASIPAPDDLAQRLMTSKAMDCGEAAFLRAKPFQPTAVEQCPQCTRPMTVKFYRNGNRMRHLCRECNSANDSEMAKIHRAERQRWEAQEREKELADKALTGKVMRQVLLAQGPMTETKLRKRMAWYADEFKKQGCWCWTSYVDSILGDMVQMGVIAAIGQTANNRTIFQMVKQYVRPEQD